MSRSPGRVDGYREALRRRAAKPDTPPTRCPSHRRYEQVRHEARVEAKNCRPVLDANAGGSLAFAWAAKRGSRPAIEDKIKKRSDHPIPNPQPKNRTKPREAAPSCAIIPALRLCNGHPACNRVGSLPIKQIKIKDIQDEDKAKTMQARSPATTGVPRRAAKLRYGARKALCHPHGCRVAPGIVRATALYFRGLQLIARSNPDRTQSRKAKSCRSPIWRIVTRRQGGKLHWPEADRLSNSASGF